MTKMAAIYATMKFKKCEGREDGEPSNAFAENEDVTYSTVTFSKKAGTEKEDVTYSNVKFSTKAGPSHSDLTRPDDPADPSPEPRSKIVMTGQTKERLLWISLCALLFAVALITGVLYVPGKISHKQNNTDKDELIKQLQTKNTNLSRNVEERENRVQQLQAEKGNLTKDLQERGELIKQLEIKNTNLSRNVEEREKIIQQLQTEKDQLTEDLQDKEKKIQQLQTEKEEQICDPQSPYVDKACCAEGWKYFRGKCYYFSTDVKTWTAGRDACVAAGGDLVIISSTEEQDFIKRSKPGEGEQRYWVGLTDAVKEGVWRWLDGTQLSQTPKYWTGKEPDDWKGKNSQYPEGEDCAVMALNTYSYALLDAFCDVEEKKSKYVCEAKAPK